MLTAWSANSLEKIRPDTPAPPGAADESPVLRLSAARGEVEAAQLVLRAEGDPVEIEGLGIEPPRVGGAELDLGVRTVEYVRVTEPSHGDGEAGLHPDPILPFKPFALEGTRPLWVDVRVPRDAEPGLHTGAIRVEAGGDRTVEARVELHVYDFTLPFPPKLVTAFGLYEKPLRDRYGERYDEMLGRYRENLWSHRVTHLAFPATDIPGPKVSTAPGGGLEIDYTDFDRAVEENIRRGMNALDVPVPAKFNKKEGKLDSPHDRATLEKILADFERHLADRGWLEMAYFFLVDEPGRRHFDAFKEIEEMLHRAAPRIRRRLDMGYGAYGAKPGEPPPAEAAYARLAGLVEIWVPHIDCVDQAFLTAEQEKGNEAWWYICCSAKHPYPNCLVDYPVLDSRVPFWMMYGAGVTGYAYWTVDWWAKDPFKDPLSYSKANGDGVLLYPGEDGPVDTIRWEATRDGFEDYEYLALLAERLARAEKSGASGEAVRAGRAALAEVKRVAASRTEYAQDPAVLIEVREKVARAIEALKVRA